MRPGVRGGSRAATVGRRRHPPAVGAGRRRPGATSRGWDRAVAGRPSGDCGKERAPARARARACRQQAKAAVPAPISRPRAATGTYRLRGRPRRAAHAWSASQRSEVTTRTAAGCGSWRQPPHDLVVGGIPARAGRVGDLDHGRADRWRRGALEHDDHVLALGRRPALEQVDEPEHRRVAVPPPAIGAGADHVHAVDVPAHQALRGGGRRSRLRSDRRRFASSRRVTDEWSAAWRGADAGRPAPPRAAGRAAAARARGCGPGCARPGRRRPPAGPAEP